MRDEKADQLLVAALTAELHLPGTALVVTAGMQPALAKTVEKMPASRVWSAEQ